MIYDAIAMALCKKTCLILLVKLILGHCFESLCLTLSWGSSKSAFLNNSFECILLIWLSHIAGYHLQTLEWWQHVLKLDCKMFLVVFEDSGIIKRLTNERDSVRECKRQKNSLLWSLWVTFSVARRSVLIWV